MDSELSQVAAAVAVADPALAAEWYELLSRSTPTPDDDQWRGLVERMAPAAQQTGLSGPQLMEALTTVDDPAALQAIIAAHAWPNAAAGDASAAQGSGSAGDGSADQAGAAAPAEEDPSAWNDFLIANGSAWDGTEPSWQPFVDWFVYHADAAGVGRSARGFWHLAGANQPLSVFAQYGIAVAAGVQEPATAATEDVATQLAALSADILADFRQDYPQFAGVDDAEVLALLNEVVIHDDPAAVAPTT